MKLYSISLMMSSVRTVNVGYRLLGCPLVISEINVGGISDAIGSYVQLRSLCKHTVPLTDISLVIWDFSNQIWMQFRLDLFDATSFDYWVIETEVTAGHVDPRKFLLASPRFLNTKIHGGNAVAVYHRYFDNLGHKKNGRVPLTLATLERSRIIDVAFYS